MFIGKLGKELLNTRHFQYIGEIPRDSGVKFITLKKMRKQEQEYYIKWINEQTSKETGEGEPEE